jgi:hypothetical protein
MILAVGQVAGAETIRTGGPVAVAPAMPLECTGDAAPTIHNFWHLRDPAADRVPGREVQ